MTSENNIPDESNPIEIGGATREELAELVDPDTVGFIERYARMSHEYEEGQFYHHAINTNTKMYHFFQDITSSDEERTMCTRYYIDFKKQLKR